MDRPIRVLLDARVRDQDGIGRVTNQLAATLNGRADVSMSTLERVEPDLYRPEALENPARVARERGSRILQLIDFRVPMSDPGIPMIAVVHDVFRITHPGLSYTDEDFAARYGTEGFRGLMAGVHRLREMAHLPRSVRIRGAHGEFLARMVTLCCSRATWVLTPTAAVAHELRELTGCRAKVRVVPWGLDHSAAGDSPRTSRQPYLVYVGQARRHKGIDDLVDSYRRSRARVAGVPIVFVGNDFRDGTAAARRMVSVLGPAARPVGAVTDAGLTRILSGARALVHLAEHEGFGFTPLEALRLGTAVVVRDLPVLRETLGEFGTFVRSPADAAGAIDALLDAPADAEWSRCARCWTARFTWARCADELHGIYRELTA